MNSKIVVNYSLVWIKIINEFDPHAHQTLDFYSVRRNKGFVRMRHKCISKEEHYFGAYPKGLRESAMSVDERRRLNCRTRSTTDSSQGVQK